MIKRIQERPYIWSVMVGVGLFAWLYEGYTPPPTQHFEPKIEASLPSVAVERIEARNYRQRLHVTAKLEASQSFYLHSKVQGTVKRLWVSEGEHVEANQIIAQINDDVAATQLEMARQDRLEAERQFNDAKRLREKAVISKDQYAVLQSRYDSAVLREQQAQEQLDHYTLRAIHRGVVTELTLKESEYLVPNTPIGRIIDDQSIKATVQLAERYYSLLDSTQNVRLSQGSNYSEGVITFVSPRIDPTSHTFEIEVIVPNEKGLWVEGMSVQAEVSLKPQKVLSVPAYVLEIDEKNQYAMDTVKGDRIQVVPVSVVSFDTDGRVNVSSDGSVQDVVVLGGLYVEGGDQVRVGEEAK